MIDGYFYQDLYVQWSIQAIINKQSNRLMPMVSRRAAVTSAVTGGVMVTRMMSRAAAPLPSAVTPLSMASRPFTMTSRPIVMTMMLMAILWLPLQRGRRSRRSYRSSRSSGRWGRRRGRGCFGRQGGRRRVILFVGDLLLQSLQHRLHLASYRNSLLLHDYRCAC